MSIRKFLLLDILLILFIFVVGEWISSIYFKSAPGQVIIQNPATFFQNDYDLGYKGKPNASFSEHKEINGKTLYSVNYELDQYGLRKLEKAKSTKPVNVVLIFGDSSTFGVGVDVNETYAGILNNSLGPDYRVINLAFLGYGPHQMLRLLELEKEKFPLGTDKVVASFYFSNLHQVRNAAGKSFWGYAGPRYQYQGGELKFSGPYMSPFAASIFRLIKKFHLGSLLARTYYQRSYNENTKEDFKLYFGILHKAQTLISNRYGIPLHILLGNEWNLDRPEVSSFDKIGAEISMVEKIIPNSKNDPSYLYKGDGHPTPKFHRELAVWMKAQILGSPSKTKVRPD